MIGSVIGRYLWAVIYIDFVFVGGISYFFLVYCNVVVCDICIV